ncbi:MAG: hypothetical protein BWY74_04463 [Firmicutes bacterium ADurb.Bin419]|nr:MAG: hypothetical protein BWY74_04463 [Firmicutes bacterium ADurb.Bin419]
MSRIQFLNTQIDNVSMSEAIKDIVELIQKKENSYIVTPNLDHIVMICPLPNYLREKVLILQH